MAYVSLKPSGVFKCVWDEGRYWTHVEIQSWKRQPRKEKHDTGSMDNHEHRPRCCYTWTHGADSHVVMAIWGHTSHTAVYILHNPAASRFWPLQLERVSIILFSMWLYFSPGLCPQCYGMSGSGLFCISVTVPTNDISAQLNAWPSAFLY